MSTLPINEENFPSNSHEKRENTETKRVEKVTKGEVVRRKPSAKKKFLSTFLSEDARDVKEYVLTDVVIPSIKDLILDMVINGFEMLLGVNGRGRRRSGSRSNKRYTDYSSISYRRSDREREDRQERVARRSIEIDDIIVETRGEAEEIIYKLADLCEDYGLARVEDLYELVGITGDHISTKWGWETVASARVIRVRGGGYLLDLPKPVYLG